MTMKTKTSRRPLEGQVAVVAGATRGAGRGIARMLGEAGAVVYCTGRSARGGPPATGVYAGRTETIDETAEMVAAHGGIGIPVRVDHTVAEEVDALVARVRRERGHLDVLVNDISEGELHDWQPFWKVSLEKGFRALRQGVHSHIITSRAAAPLMIERRRGVIVEVGDGDTLDYRGTLFFDLVKVNVSRLAYAMAEELRPHGVTALAITPGFLRSEMMLDHFGVTEANWRDGAKKDPNFIASETPCFVGRAVAALAGDPRVIEKSGGLYSSWRLAREYGFTDLDGTQPDIGSRIDFDALYARSAKTPFRWVIAPRPQPAAPPRRRVSAGRGPRQRG